MSFEKLDILEELLIREDQMTNIFFVSETRLKKSDPKQLYEIPGYSLHKKHRTIGDGCPLTNVTFLTINFDPISNFVVDERDPKNAQLTKSYA